MFVHIRRHQKWLWFLISGFVIVSFVWFFNPNQQMQGGGRGEDGRSIVGSIYGDPITNSELIDAHHEALLQYRLAYGQWPQNDEFTRQMRPVETIRRQRLFLTRKLKDYNIKIGDRELVDWIANAFSDPETRTYNPQIYQGFLDQMRREVNLRESDLHRFVRHQIGIEHLQAIAGAPGKLVTPQEAQRALLTERERIDTKVVLFPLSNYLAKVEATPEAVANYYTNAMARYRLPERVQLSYVPFVASNFLAQADVRIAEITNLNQHIDSVYMQRGPQFYTDLDGQPMTPEAAKQQIREELRKDGALMEARRAAYEFAIGLENVEINPANPNPAEPLENLAASKGLEVKVTEPFSQFTGPAELNVPDQFSRIAFQLNPAQPIRLEPISGEDSVYVVAFKRRIPSEFEPFETIRERVANDYRMGEAFKLTREAATEFLAAATNAIAGGGQIETVAQEQGLSVVDLPPILRESREPVTGLPPMVDVGALRSAATDLRAAEISSFTPTREGGFVVMLEEVIPPSDEEIQEQLPTFVREYRRRSAVDAFNSWFAKEMQNSRLTLAGERQEIEPAQ